MSAAAATERNGAPYAQIGDGFRHKKESEPNILLLPRARIGRLPLHPSSEPAFPTSGATHGSGRNVSPVLLPRTDRTTFSIEKLRCAPDLPGRRSHEFRSNRMADILAKDGVDCGEVALFQRPATYLPYGLKLIRTACSPKSDANAGLIQEPTNSEVNYALAEVFPSKRVQLACCIQILGELW